MGYTPLTTRTPARKPIKRKPVLPKFNENIVDEDIVNDIDELAPEKEVCAAADQTTTVFSTAAKCSVVNVSCARNDLLKQVRKLKIW
ncbi:hypothetical protein DPMN_138667 [Dreissena polymorpha]|uniref:Uncharacterized protein n=1 Tax=Dreissena polymorpha TaxID=45954 RepID=A0A9D4JK23_DREPO|nr:hypothetical protein DPMN_138667 [Dreissena polymorpha]